MILDILLRYLALSERWYEEGENVQAKLPILSTYMGHFSILSTQYYLRYIEEVVSTASKRFEKHYGSLV